MSTEQKIAMNIRMPKSDHDRVVALMKKYDATRTWILLQGIRFMLAHPTEFGKWLIRDRGQS
jgi:hypothetical protein